MSLLIAAGGVCLCIGLGLLVAGMRGRRLDDHPVCHRCRFDLAGIFPGREVCPECGASLDAARAVRRGNRRRRPRVLALGVALLAIGVGATGGGAYSSAAGVNWNRYKPGWLLSWEARSLDVAPAGAALEELSRRIVDGSLAKKRIEALVEEALALQADEHASWIPGWGDVVETAHTNGLVTEDGWREYIRRSATVSFVARARQRAGGDIHCELRLAPDRCGSDSMTTASVKGGEVRIDGVNRSKAFPGGGSVAFSPQGTSSFSVLAAAQELPPGTYAVTASYEIGLGQGWTSGEPPVVVVEGEQSIEIELVGPEAELVKVIEDSASLESVRGTIGVKPIKVEPAGQNKVHVTTNVWFGAREYPLAFDLFLRDETGREWPLESGTVMSAGIGKTGFGAGVDIAGPFEPTEVDLILRASTHRAEQKPGITEILGGTIVVPNVKVIHEAEPPE